MYQEAGVSIVLPGTGEMGTLRKEQLHQNTTLISELAAELGSIITLGSRQPRFPAESYGWKSQDWNSCLCLSCGHTQRGLVGPQILPWLLP